MRRIVLGPALAITFALGAPAFAADDAGARLYFNHCAACHGDEGEGTGPVAASMRVTVPNLRSLAQRNGGAFPTDAVRAYVDGRSIPVAHGDRLMPIWGDVFVGADRTADDRTVRRRIAAVVDFISTLQYREALP
ncbi:MAG TPA: cytochrome c [Gammaproteobacteria bacterium]|nr:cytochrome c [Gammaproteobacteria bacterium]